MLVRVNPSTPCKNDLNLSFFLLYAQKCKIFAQQFFFETLVNVMMYFAGLWCNLKKNIFGKIFVPFVEQWPNGYQYQHLTRIICNANSKHFTKNIVSKFIKASMFNGNKHKGLNKHKNIRFCL